MLMSAEKNMARMVQCTNCGSEAGEDCVGRSFCWPRIEAALMARRNSKAHRA